MAALSSLAPTLTELNITSSHLPPTLSALTLLRRLHIENVSDARPAAAGLLEAALPALQRLTALALDGSSGTAPLSTIAGLPLKRLAILPAHSSVDAAQSLPAGSWQGSCCQLGASAALLAASAGALHAARSLRHLCLFPMPTRFPNGAAAWTAFWDAIASIHSLTALSFDLTDASPLFPAPVSMP
ncbi:hypothetical protein ABPG75_010540 [Micractinium tetrahymenae]